MSEENVRRQLELPWIKIATDAGGYDPAWGEPLGPVHPRSYGTYPRVLGQICARGKGATLEDAIHKMTWAVAARLGLRDRGLLQAGYYADVVIFDPADHRRSRHLRGFTPAFGRRARCLGQWRARAGGRRSHRRHTGTHRRRTRTAQRNIDSLDSCI